jgi:hypothetical protein
MKRTRISEFNYAKVVYRLGKEGAAKLEERARLAGVTPREYVERQEQRRLDQALVSRATWIDLRAPGETAQDGDAI